MPDVEILAALAAPAPAFAIGGTYYTVFGEQLAAASDLALHGRELTPDAPNPAPGATVVSAAQLVAA